jgi:hypothetical protein
MLHEQTDTGDACPTAEAEKNRFAAGLYQLNNICIQTNRCHCHYDEELAEPLQE